MAESPSSTSKSNPQKVLIIMEKENTVPQHILQINDHEDDNGNNNNENKDTDEEVDQNPGVITRANIGEISKEEEANRPLKKQKHRSLVSIYTATKPMNINC
ncbi:hypothetical protein CIPAW_04G087900 [Carya illinoinensis]|uniref:Uncharacterized protein n=1 Tax=Carya illinoinensis TaxID=32201 RepID=A0A8T1QTB6_CARIL|nr:hypothetical protein CIPAW_04G087900 [Carya illinoinensis]KAG6717215.1 hypothetical protein I3842_04G087100 [Carya illinoinensis]